MFYFLENRLQNLIFLQGFTLLGDIPHTLFLQGSTLQGFRG